ncbi:RsmE family RNA methyltransferase [Puia dinghuensis]|uniref:Ribosomal RNA small subunit methyltransferase E n=1 Tax=Puia dinghuensis TaxID=1792502 RepID=A0A8J2UEI5_9BACT|nr:RsmE family RNA methyltransferase [Puia dinghuensis]GGB06567.1 ribosomal RNA small subunit methyltransferase E [Puia dinghuensis]
MALPLFYISSFDPANPEIMLDEDNSRHIIQVLRMRPGEGLQLTDGRGALLTAVIIDDNKKKCRVRVGTVTTQPPPKKTVAVAISPLKNASRFEWFLEKATEIGVTTIIPLLSERTERQHNKPERWQNILVSAMLQSQQTWLPELSAPTPFSQLLHTAKADDRLIAHCLEAPRPTASLAALIHKRHSRSSLILIGPEGDFSQMEVESALAEGFIPVTLGAARLRTETAGIVAATLLCIDDQL